MATKWPPTTTHLQHKGQRHHVAYHHVTATTTVPLFFQRAGKCRKLFLLAQVCSLVHCMPLLSLTWWTLGSVITSYGAFWMSYATILIPASSILSVFADPSELESALANYLIAWLWWASCYCEFIDLKKGLVPCHAKQWPTRQVSWCIKINEQWFIRQRT